jgi:hypothetical protein
MSLQTMIYDLIILYIVTINFINNFLYYPYFPIIIYLTISLNFNYLILITISLSLIYFNLLNTFILITILTKIIICFHVLSYLFINLIHFHKTIIHLLTLYLMFIVKYMFH